MNLHHDLFLMKAGLDRMPIRSPMSVATICAIDTTPPKTTLEDFIRAADTARNMTPPQTEMKLTEAEFARLKDKLSEVVGWRPYGFDFKAPDHPEFMGLRIVIAASNCLETDAR